MVVAGPGADTITISGKSGAFTDTIDGGSGTDSVSINYAGITGITSFTSWTVKWPAQKWTWGIRKEFLAGSGQRFDNDLDWLRMQWIASALRIRRAPLTTAGVDQKRPFS